MTDFKSPRDAREYFRNGGVARPTAGLCPGYAQGNLIILPRADARDFAEFCARNPKPCPVLEQLDVGERETRKTAPGGDIARDIPLYRVWQNGVLAREMPDVSGLWREDLISFLIGCSFSFEQALVRAGIPMRHIDEGRNVPMFLTNIDTVPAGRFGGKMVVSMRPMSAENARLAHEITAKMPRVHGAPIHIGDGRDIGVIDVTKPDFGDAVTVNDGEVCVFWACGVTPQSVVMNACPPFAITHAPGHMFICDITNDRLESRGGE